MGRVMAAMRHQPVVLCAMCVLAAALAACQSPPRGDAVKPGAAAQPWTFAADRLPVDFRRAAAELGWAVQRTQLDADTGTWHVTLQLPSEQFMLVTAQPVGHDTWHLTARRSLDPPDARNDPDAVAYLQTLRRTLAAPPARAYGGRFDLPPR
mgnify:CR=1 FL=1